MKTEKLYLEIKQNNRTIIKIPFDLIRKEDFNIPFSILGNWTIRIKRQKNENNKSRNNKFK